MFIRNRFSEERDDDHGEEAEEEEDDGEVEEVDLRDDGRPELLFSTLRGTVSEVKPHPG